MWVLVLEATWHIQCTSCVSVWSAVSKEEARTRVNKPETNIRTVAHVRALVSHVRPHENSKRCTSNVQRVPEAKRAASTLPHTPKTPTPFVCERPRLRRKRAGLTYFQSPASFSIQNLANTHQTSVLPTSAGITVRCTDPKRAHLPFTITDLIHTKNAKPSLVNGRKW
jgi:hypothetical protein